MYHEIIVPDTQAHEGDPIYSIEENIFIKQIEYLHNSNHKSISLNEYVKLCGQSPDPKSNEPLIETPVIITFDDGHVYKPSL